MQLTTIRIDKPDATNFILGQTHFIKSVEDIHEALVGAVPGIKFGLAFCEASGKCLVRSSGTDAAMVELAQKNAMALGAGHCFIVFLGEGYYPVNVLNAIKMVPEVCRIFCATANPVEAMVAETDQGRGLLGVIDGFSPKGIEGEDDVAWRKIRCGSSATSCEQRTLRFEGPSPPGSASCLLRPRAKRFLAKTRLRRMGVRERPREEKARWQRFVSRGPGNTWRAPFY